MKISNNYTNYDSIVNGNLGKEKVSSTIRIKSFFEAFRVDLSQRALNSKEIEDPEINFPTYNTDVLQYSENLNLIFKP